MPYTTTELLADVRRNGMLPATSTTGTADADLLAHADKEMQSRVVPLVLSSREEFYVRSHDVSLTAAVAAYRLPSRAIAGRLRDVQLILSDGTARDLPRIQPEDAPFWGIGSQPYPMAFYMERDSVVLVPTPSTTAAATLRMKYFGRPGFLVATSYAISAIDTSLNTVTVTNGAAVYTTSTPVDLVSASSPFDCLAIDQTPSAAVVAGANVTLTLASLPSALAVGDFVALAGYSPVPQIPVEFHNYLAQRTLCRILQAMGDSEALRNAEADAEQMREAAVSMLTNRVEGAQKKVVGSLLFRRRLGGW